MSIQIALDLADKRRALCNRFPKVKCPRCGEAFQMQLKDWITQIIWRCRMCFYEWEEISWGAKNDTGN